MKDIILAAIILAFCIGLTAYELHRSRKIERRNAECERTIKAFDKLLASSRKQIAETARSAEEAQMGADRP